jgi:aminoglycoside phosphotransferase (APT) family kinase protein
MDSLKTSELERYLSSLWGPSARILRCVPIGKAAPSGDAKGFGYGVPLRIDVEVEGRTRSVVLETMSANSFGHEHRADRAQAILWSHSAYNELPKHARSVDVGATRTSGDLVSLGSADEFFVLMEFVGGEGYATDLARIRDTGVADGRDVARADALCDYLLEIHRVRGTEPGLYVRRVRELVGHGECIMGILDSYPPGTGLLSASALKDIELRCVDWRWKLKPLTHRLRQVHGDFHPWNILFRKGAEFSVLDRSRGEWGDPADDVTCLTLNYLFFSLQRSGRLEGAFERLWRRFWERYLERTRDAELLEVAGLFFAFRGLVMANPLWYPALDAGVRCKIFRFIQAVLDAERFEPARVNAYCG